MTVVLTLVYAMVMMVAAAIITRNTAAESVQKPVVIAHRGASGYLPEHSIEAYHLAMDLGADFIEPDLCLTKDGVFVALHDVLLDKVTDVYDHSKFRGRNTSKIVDGFQMTGMFVNDFTYSELSELRLVQRIRSRATVFDGLFHIPTLQEIIKLAKATIPIDESDRRIPIGLYPELKHPSYFRSLGFDIEEMFLQELRSHGILDTWDTTNRSNQGKSVNKNNYNSASSPMIPLFIQSFDPSSLKILREKAGDAVSLVQLIDTFSFFGSSSLSSSCIAGVDSDCLWLSTSESNNNSSYFGTLKQISTYANGVGLNKEILSGSGVSFNQAKDIVNSAHQLNLVVHPWTFRKDLGVLPRFHGDFNAESEYFLCCLGVDGIFTEHPGQTRFLVDSIYSHWLVYGAKSADATTAVAVEGTADDGHALLSTSNKSACRLACDF